MPKCATEGSWRRRGIFGISAVRWTSGVQPSARTYWTTNCRAVLWLKLPELAVTVAV